jgi:hypothetical protein
MDPTAPSREMVAIAQRLQLKWLKRMEQLLDAESITSTDMATLARLLSQNGWTLDPTQLPQNLRDKLTSHVSFDDDLKDGPPSEFH